MKEVLNKTTKLAGTSVIRCRMTRKDTKRVHVIDVISEKPASCLTISAMLP